MLNSDEEAQDCSTALLSILWDCPQLQYAFAGTKMLNNSHKKAFSALRRLAKKSHSSFWKSILGYGWTARSAPSKQQIKENYDRAARLLETWKSYTQNRHFCIEPRKYKLRCQKQVRMYLEYSKILEILLKELEKENVCS